MKKVLFGSGNINKFNDIQKIAHAAGFELIMPSDLMEHSSIKSAPPKVVEDSGSYFGNAMLKARQYADWSGLPCVVDDSGLEISALNGAPGVETANYAGSSGSDTAIQDKILVELQGISHRQARFYSLMVYRDPSLSGVVVAEGILNGNITQEPRGTSGWGQEPIFEVAGLGKTISELREHGTLKQTHRLIAAQNLFEALAKLFPINKS